MGRISMFSPIRSAHFIDPENQLIAWTCRMTKPSAIISDMNLHKRKIRFLPITYITVRTETSVLNHINFISYDALFTSKHHFFLYGILSTYFMVYKLQWMKKVYTHHTVEYQRL